MLAIALEELFLSTAMNGGSTLKATNLAGTYITQNLVGLKAPIFLMQEQWAALT